MRAGLLAWCVLAIAGCKSGAEAGPPRSEPPPPITATPETSAPPSATPPPTLATETPPPQIAHPRADGGAASLPRKAAPSLPQCQKDGDCTLTRVPEGDCCPMLCTPRAVTQEEGRRLDERVRQCEAENHPCRAPACRPKALQAACVAGTCTARRFDEN